MYFSLHNQADLVVAALDISRIEILMKAKDSYIGGKFSKQPSKNAASSFCLYKSVAVAPFSSGGKAP